MWKKSKWQKIVLTSEAEVYTLCSVALTGGLMQAEALIHKKKKVRTFSLCLRAVYAHACVRKVII